MRTYIMDQARASQSMVISSPFFFFHGKRKFMARDEDCTLCALRKLDLRVDISRVA